MARGQDPYTSLRDEYLSDSLTNMPKIIKYPRLRTKVYKSKGGQAYVYYTYDMRPEGKPDARLGSDYEQAIAQWDELHNKRPLTIGRLEEAFARWEEKELPQYSSPETRKGYTKNLRAIRPVFGQMAWDEVDLPILRRYLDLRSAKVQGNRELSLLQIIWSKALIWGLTKQQWPAMGVKNWKNTESAREFEVTSEMFRAVYAQSDQILRDCMDIASATGLRLTDARTVKMPVDGMIVHRASKTAKAVQYIAADSPVLSAIVERRESMEAYCPMLLSTSTGRAVSMQMLRSRWDDARDAAAYRAEIKGNRELGERIRAMYLRDMRKLAADLAESLEAASELLQHSSKSLTQKHYRTKAVTVKTVR